MSIAPLLPVMALGLLASRAPRPACADLSLPAGAECRTITVWEDRTRNAGRQLEIRYVVLRAEQRTGADPVFLLAGGPGQGSTDMVEIGGGPLAPVHATRDLVFVDQRGTGGSNPLRCRVDLDGHPERAFGHVFDPVVFRACRPELERRADLRWYTSELAARDLDDVRAALGAERVILWGGSYGTRLAQTYMKLFPKRVGAAVLDGVVPFDFRAPAGYAATLQQSLDRVFADCAADSTCRTANPALRQSFDRLVERIRAGPVSATVTRANRPAAAVQFSSGDFTYAVRGILYSAAASRGLPALIHRADSTGDVSPFAQRYFERAANFGDFADGLHFAIFCAEDTQFISEAEIPDLVRGSFGGRYLIDEYRAVCADWVTAPIAAATREPLREPIPTLLVSGWFDPVTPPETAARVARELPNARHVVVRDQAHGAGFGCARPATLHVLIHETLDGLPTVCERVTSLWN